MATKTAAKPSTPKAAVKKAARVTLSSIPINRGTYVAKSTQAKRQQKPPTKAQLAKVPEKCKHGHEMKGAPENVYVYPEGGVACRRCSAIIDERSRAKAKATKEAAKLAAAKAAPQEIKGVKKDSAKGPREANGNGLAGGPKKAAARKPRAKKAPVTLTAAAGINDALAGK